MVDNLENAGAVPANEEPSQEAAPAKTEAPSEGDTQASTSEKPGEPSGEQKRPSGAQRNKARIAELMSENARLRNALSSGEAPKPPKPDDFGSWDEYQTADRAHLAKSAASEAVNAIQQQEIERRQAEIVSLRQAEYAGQVDEIRKVVPDFDAVLKQSASWAVSDAVARELAGSDDVAALQYYLAKNPAVLADLNALPAEAVARRIGRIEAEASRVISERTTTKAPPPVGAVKGGSIPNKAPDTMSYLDFKRFREGGGKIG